MFKNKAAYVLLMIFFIAAVAGCAAKHQPEKAGINTGVGEKIKVHYTCRSDSGEIVDTTEPAIAGDSKEAKSWMFQTRKEYDPVSITVGQDSPYQTKGKVKYFYPEIYSKLAHAVNGKTKGNTYEVVIESPIPEGIKDFSRYSSTKTFREVPVRFTNALADFKKVNGRDPVMGEVFNMNGRPYYKVVGIDKKQVTFKMIFGTATVDTPWGQADVLTEGNTVKTFIHAKEGTLVLLNGVAGKITEVTDKKIKVDYGYPLGEPSLKCSVTILEDAPEEKSTETGSTGEKSEGGI